MAFPLSTNTFIIKICQERSTSRRRRIQVSQEDDQYWSCGPISVLLVYFEKWPYMYNCKDLRKYISPSLSQHHHRHHQHHNEGDAQATRSTDTDGEEGEGRTRSNGSQVKSFKIFRMTNWCWWWSQGGEDRARSAGDEVAIISQTPDSRRDIFRCIENGK